MKWKPHKYQETEVRNLLANPAWFLGAEPGLGKTSITLAAIKVLLEADAIDAALVIAPLHVCNNVWPNEVAKWDDFADLEIVHLHGPKKADRLSLPADIYLVNPESFKWLDEQVRDGKFEMPSMLVVDESTKFKNSQSRRFKLLREWIPHFERRYCLTGTPMPNNALDLFAQFFIIDGGQRLGRYITHYRNKWFYQTGYGGYTWLPVEGAMDEIEERIADVSSFLKADDHLDMPKLVVNDVMLSLDPESDRLYGKLEEEFLAEVGGETILARNGGALTSKLRQLTSGCIYVGEDSARSQKIHETKLDALDSILEERQGQPTLVGFEFQHSVPEFEARFGKRYRCGYAHGKVSASKVRRTIDAWNYGEVEVLFAHPGSIGHGVNLQGVSNCVVWYGLPYDFEHYDQFVRRIYRQGQKHRVFVHRLLMRDTVDEDVRANLGRKDRDQGKLIGAIQARARRHRRK